MNTDLERLLQRAVRDKALSSGDFRELYLVMMTCDPHSFISVLSGNDLSQEGVHTRQAVQLHLAHLTSTGYLTRVRHGLYRINVSCSREVAE